MNDSDLCRHCGHKRSEHTGRGETFLKCPHGMGYTTAENFDPHAVNAGPFTAALHGIGQHSESSAERKACPLYTGCLAYFPDALMLVAKLSKIGNDKHNPGQPLHWSKDKSNDHADCLARHLLQHGQTDPETGLSHTVSVAWRALALLQTEIEAARKAGAQ